MTFLRTVAIIVGFSLFFLASEILYRQLFHAATLANPLETFAILVVFVSLFYFTHYRFTRWLIVGFFGLSTLINNVHYQIYESWINSTNYLLMFTEIVEITTAGITMLDRVLPAALWGVMEILVFIAIGKYRRKTTKWADILFVLFFAYMFIRSFTTSNDIGLTPRNNYSRIKANTFSFSAFIGRTLPYEWFELSDLPDYSHPKPAVAQAPKVRQIIFIVGESFSANHLHSFGYARHTTPFLDSMAQRAVLKPTYAAGLGTAISLPALFNAVPYPNGLRHIVRGDTNLFRLAQAQQFATAFHSAQPEWQMEILGIMGKKWIDQVTFPTQLGYSVQDSMNDHKVLPYLYQTDLSQGRHFIVLHQRGSHAPYAKYLSPEEKRFSGDTPLDNYDSTIYDTDRYIQKVFEHLSQQPTDDWLLIYTSDHGQHVTQDVYNQGTTAEGSYLVPLLIYSPNATLQQTIASHFASCPKAFHQQLATLLIHLMGYAMPVSGCESGVINANLLTGNSGYLQVDKQGKVEFVYPNGRKQP